jgi:hypothetical protein
MIRLEWDGLKREDIDGTDKLVSSRTNRKAIAVGRWDENKLVLETLYSIKV